MKIRKNEGTTFVETLMVIAIICLIAAVAIPNLLRARAEGNTTNARQTLKTVATALENYTIGNGTYPNDINDLITDNPPYLLKNYFNRPYSGYNFIVDSLSEYLYSVSAIPIGPETGTGSFTITTGGLLHKND